MPSLEAALNVTIAFTLLIASALLGLMTGLIFRVWAIALVSPPIAIFSAIFLRAHGYGFAGGVTIIIGCLATCQTAYLAGVFMSPRSHRAANLTQEEIDGDPGSRGEQNIRDDDK
jgi:hypothetical protein